ncbi:transcriptional regulator [Aliifodinibius salipaludis]|uniref:Transcriptional regulator n=1 Tax=Fodinibius salipaludis TaxID=2032627 RepID=A0A2A2G7Q8_9BACT|nr:sigma-54 dependent transcriptional regulator [Aliifodinibius salipaludis]PAU92863.1 transcriptional regulator [Aliifodinibius salipaludis]
MEENSLSDNDINKKKGSKKPVFITQNPTMKDLLGKVRQVAKTKATLLISGENGTGKEVLAQLVHYHSNRSENELVAINCGAIPSELVESELFGHEKGAFTGAHARKEGCFELAHKSTLFLDEIGEMPKSVQVKLLRAVELGSFRRVGGKEEVNVDISLISATNKVLFDQVQSGSFREDLFYRLNVIELYVPPLRHRKEDIPLLVDFYKSHFVENYGIEEIVFSEEIMEMFLSYDWPGNVRELKNIVERSVVLADGEEVTPDVIPSRIHRGENIYPVSKGSAYDKIIQIPIGTSLEEIERKVIDHTLYSVDNNKTEAAKILGFSRKTLHNKLTKYEAEKEAQESTS